jgi:DNA-binding MarR family transcriptional regulator
MLMQESNQENKFISSKDKRLALLVWFRLARFYNYSIKQTNQHLQQWGITMSQFDALNQIGLHQPITQQQLGERLEVTKGNITQLLKRMEASGWIVREQDWKIKYISLTETGQQLYKTVIPRQEQFQINQFCGLDSDEQAQLLHLLKKLQKSTELKENNT